jgi:outer membrane protein TolC
MRRVILFFICAAFSLTGLRAGDEPFFPKPSYFKHHFSTVSNKVELKAPARLGDFVVSDRLELSLKNYLDLVLSNNPDISIQKLQVEFQQNAITRAFGVFDPAALARFTTTRQETPARDALQGAATVNQLSQPLNLSYTQLLPTGTSYNVAFGNTKLSTNSSFATFNPGHSSNLNFNVTQPLLRGRGGYVTRLPITIARSRLRSGQFSLEDQVIQIISNAELAYWAVIEARENLRVQEKALELADTALKRSNRELELGAISSLEIFQPQANFASAQISVTQARYRLQQTEDALRRQMGADQDPKYRDTPIVLTEAVAPPTDTTAFDKEKLVERAVARRPDIRAITETIAADDLQVAQYNNQLLPDLSLTAQYGSFGQGGVYYSKQNVFLGDGTSSQVVNVIPGGPGDALGQLFGFGFPTYGFGLTLRLPIRDRVTTANLADALVSKKLDAYRHKQAVLNTRLQVLQAINQVENSKASVELAKVARDLAQKRVDAEQKRYELGTTTIFFVLAAQQDFTTAESTLVRESINYRRNLINLLQRTGELLDDRGITIQ